MRSSINRRFVLGLTVKILRVCGVAGLVGLLLATAVGYLGAKKADNPALTTEISVPRTSSSLVIFDQRQDRLDKSRQRTAKADMLYEPLSAAEATQFLAQKQINRMEISAASELDEPFHLAPGLERETMTFSEATVPDAVDLITPEVLNDRLTTPPPIDDFRAPSLQQRSRATGSTVRRSGRAASGVAGKATGAFGL